MSRKGVGIVGLLSAIASLIVILSYFGLTPHNIISQITPPAPTNIVITSVLPLNITYVNDSNFRGYLKLNGTILCPTTPIIPTNSFMCNFNITDGDLLNFNRTIYDFSVQPSKNFTIVNVIPSQEVHIPKDGTIAFRVYITTTNVPYVGPIQINLHAH